MAANLLILIALSAGALIGEPLRVCLNDTARLGSEVHGSVRVELGRLLAGVEILPVCGSRPLTTARISFLAAASRPLVLGSTLRTEERVLPVIEVYVGAVLRALNGRADVRTLGKALARVAAHEAVHYFEQKTMHDQTGLLRPAFSGAELALGDACQYFWTRHRTD
jgi:hypothetical protein